MRIRSRKVATKMLQYVIRRRSTRQSEDVLRLRTDILRRRFDRISGIRVRTNDSWSALASVVKSVTPQGS